MECITYTEGIGGMCRSVTLIRVLLFVHSYCITSKATLEENFNNSYISMALRLWLLRTPKGELRTGYTYH